MNILLIVTGFFHHHHLYNKLDVKRTNNRFSVFSLLPKQNLLHSHPLVFHSLLKAHAVEARAVVKQALEILTPAMPGRREDGNVGQGHDKWVKVISKEIKNHVN